MLCGVTPWGLVLGPLPGAVWEVLHWWAGVVCKHGPWPRNVVDRVLRLWVYGLLSRGIVD